MSNYTKFRIEATQDNTYFRVEVKNWLGFWVSGFVYTDYFSAHYLSKEDAKKAIEGYKNRYTYED